MKTFLKKFRFLSFYKFCSSKKKSVESLYLQKNGHGRINFLQFKTFIANLKAWQGVFKMYSKEKAGILRAERLRDALYDVGFQLSSDIMSIIMLKYMRKDGTLRLGDFASAILHLTTAFGMMIAFGFFYDISPIE